MNSSKCTGNLVASFAHNLSSSYKRNIYIFKKIKNLVTISISRTKKLLEKLKKNPQLHRLKYLKVPNR